MRWVDKLADAFGGLPFIVGYNILTFLWVYLGLTDKHFFDPFPSNFYTLTVSWLAINMSSLILWSERRKKAREQAEDERQRKTTESILKLAISMEQMLRVLTKRADGEGREHHEPYRQSR